MRTSPSRFNPENLGERHRLHLHLGPFNKIGRGTQATPAGRDFRFLAEGLTFALLVVIIIYRSRVSHQLSLSLSKSPSLPSRDFFIPAGAPRH
ncbi:hypothetical protein ES705_47362 [subsurface metagenome]